MIQLPDLDSFMRHVFEQAAGQQASLDDGKIVQSVQTVLRRDYETAFNLLHRASEAFPILMRRCEALETDLHETRTQAQAEVSAASEVTEKWHRLALALKEKLDENEQELADLRARLVLAEAQIADGRRQVDDAEHQAEVAIGITTLFHDKIVEAFGVGSSAHAALDLVVKAAADRPKTIRSGTARDRG